MPTLLRKLDSKPSVVRDDHVQGPTGAWYLLTEVSDGGLFAVGDAHDVIDLPKREVKALGVDGWPRQFSKIFAYTILAPAGEELRWVRDFIRGPERSDSLPASWSEQALTNGSGDQTHTLCTYNATVEIARGMRYVQHASHVESHIQDGVAMVQRIRPLADFSGWRSVSRLPNERPEELYKPGDVYQLVAPAVYDPDANSGAQDPRGSALTQSQLLEAYGLTPMS